MSEHTSKQISEWPSICVPICVLTKPQCMMMMMMMMRVEKMMKRGKRKGDHNELMMETVYSPGTGFLL